MREETRRMGEGGEKAWQQQKEKEKGELIEWGEVKKKKQKGELFIPWDVWCELILPHVSGRDLQNLKSVCKDWVNQIRSPYFVRLHRSCRANRIRVVLTFPSTIVDYCYQNTTLQIPYTPQYSSWTTKIAGSADGLICIIDGFTKDDGIRYCITAIFNPSTGKYFRAHLCEKDFNLVLRFWWFGKHAGEYVLVTGIWIHRHSPPRTCVEFGVYKFGRTHLKRIHSILVDRPPIYLSNLDHRGTLAHGAVHWPVLQLNHKPPRYKIFAYHIATNTPSEIKPPMQGDFRLGVNVDGCLFATLLANNYTEGSVFEVWIMKEYSSCSWTKYTNIDIKGFNSFRVLSPLGVFPNGDMVLDLDKSKLIKYNFHDNQPLLLIEYDCPRYEAIMCPDTLVSPQIWDL